MSQEKNNEHCLSGVLIIKFIKAGNSLSLLMNFQKFNMFTQSNVSPDIKLEIKFSLP